MIRLVTFLGTGDYKPTDYSPPDGGPAVNSPFVARAIASMVSAHEVVVLATEEAESKHAKALLRAFSEGALPEPRLMRTPAGANQSELWDLFDAMKRALRAGADSQVSEIVLDITHGFRIQPFFAAAVLSYLRALDEGSLPVRVLYGAYQVGTPGPTPIWDMTAFVQLQEWSSAVMLFLRTGRAEGVAGPTERLGRELNKSWAAHRQGPRPPIFDLARELRVFADDLATVRTGPLLLGTDRTGGSAKKLLDTIDRAQTEASSSLPILTDVLTRAREMVEPLTVCGPSAPDSTANALCTPEGQRAIAALAELYIGLDRYLEAVATLKEGWTSLFAAEAGAVPGTPNYDRNARDAAEDRWHRMDANGRRQIGELRNDLLHAGYTRNTRSPKSLRDGAIQCLSRFKETAVPWETPLSSARTGFVNLTNHPFSEWPPEALEAARRLAPDLEYLPFPSVPPDADRRQLDDLCKKTLDQVSESTAVALVMGEFVLTTTLVRELQQRGIRCVATAGSRDSEVDPSGVRVSRFHFTDFREYPPLASG